MSTVPVVGLMFAIFGLTAPTTFLGGLLAGPLGLLFMAVLSRGAGVPGAPAAPGASDAPESSSASCGLWNFGGALPGIMTVGSMARFTVFNLPTRGCGFAGACFCAFPAKSILFLSSSIVLHSSPVSSFTKDTTPFAFFIFLHPGGKDVSDISLLLLSCSWFLSPCLFVCLFAIYFFFLSLSKDKWVFVFENFFIVRKGNRKKRKIIF